MRLAPILPLARALSKETSSLQAAMQLCRRDLIFPVCSVCNSVCCAHAHFLRFSFRQRVNGQHFALLHWEAKSKKHDVGSALGNGRCATLDLRLSAKREKLHFLQSCGNFMEATRFPWGKKLHEIVKRRDRIKIAHIPLDDYFILPVDMSQQPVLVERWTNSVRFERICSRLGNNAAEARRKMSRSELQHHWLPYMDLHLSPANTYISRSQNWCALADRALQWDGGRIAGWRVSAREDGYIYSLCVLPEQHFEHSL